MHLDDLVARYVRERELAPRSVEQLQIAVRVYSRHLSHRAAISDLTDDSANGWLLAMQEGGSARETIRSKRVALLTLWRYAANELKIVDRGPERVRRIKRIDQPPQAWRHDELAVLREECGRLRGRFRTIALPRALYMLSLIDGKYDTALRLGDMQSIEFRWISPSGTLCIVQRKTGRSHRAQLRESTLEEIDQLMRVMPERRLIWPAFCGRGDFSRFFKQLVTRAGLRGSSKWIRRSSASYYEKEHPGEAWRHLGHAAPGLDKQNYIDVSIAYPAPHLPPAIPPRIA